METARTGRFFYKLLGGFLLTAAIPTLFISISFGLLSQKALERTLEERTGEAVLLVAGYLQSFFESSAQSLASVAQNPLVKEYLSPLQSRRSAELTADVQRLLYSTARTNQTELFLIPRQFPPQGPVPLGTAPLPPSYAGGPYAHWGILGELERFSQDRGSAVAGSIILFGRPHTTESEPTVLALGYSLYPWGNLIMDIKRSAVSERLANAKETFSELLLVDDSDCILFDMSRPYREGQFEDTSQVLAGTSIAQDRGRIETNISLRENLRLIVFQPLAPIEAQSTALRTITYISALVSLLVAVVLSFLLSQTISDPVQSLVRVMSQVEKGNLGARVAGYRHDELGDLIKSFNRMIARVQRLMEETVEQQQLLRHAEAQNLQARIDPHFLYNTLNTIKSIAKLHGISDIAKISTRLGKLLRAGFTTEGEFSILEDDVDLARGYLEIQSIRYPGKFTYNLHLEPEVMGVTLPRLLIEPLIENAVVHGLEKKVGPGTIGLYACRIENKVKITIEDDGPGIPPHRLRQIKAALTQAEMPVLDIQGSPIEPGSSAGTLASRRGAGMALVNTHRRLRLLYGSGYGLELTAREGKSGGTRVVVTIPFQKIGVNP